MSELNLAEVINRFGDALKKEEILRRGAAELNFNTN